jgi:hypothetical protein
VAAAATALIALAGCGGGGGDEGPKGTITPLVEPEQERMLSVLRGEPEPIPEQLRPGIEQTDERAGLDLELDLAQLVETDYEQQAWVVPGQGKVCILRVDASSAACADNPDFARRGTSLRIPARTERNGRRIDVELLLGLVPDRARVEVIRGGTRIRVRVRDNVFAYVGEPPMRTRVLRDRGRR